MAPRARPRVRPRDARPSPNGRAPLRLGHRRRGTPRTGSSPWRRPTAPRRNRAPRGRRGWPRRRAPPRGRSRRGAPRPRARAPAICRRIRTRAYRPTWPGPLRREGGGVWVADESSRTRGGWGEAAGEFARSAAAGDPRDWRVAGTHSDSAARRLCSRSSPWSIMRPPHSSGLPRVASPASPRVFLRVGHLEPRVLPVSLRNPIASASGNPSKGIERDSREGAHIYRDRKRETRIN